MTKENMTADQIRGVIGSLPETMSNVDMASLFANIIYCYNAQSDAREILKSTVNFLLMILDHDADAEKVHLN